MAQGRSDRVSHPLKILRVIARLNVGGPARHVVLLDQGLRARGHQTLLVHGAVGAGEASLEHLAQSEQLRIVKVPELGPRITVFSDFRAFLKLLRVTFREAPDVIHTHTAKAGTLGRAAAVLYNATRSRNRRALIVHTFHGHVLSGYFGPVGNGLVRCVERTMAKMTDCVITISASQRDDIVGKFRVAPEARVATVPLGLNLQPLLSARNGTSMLRERGGIPARDIVFGYVGRFVPIKNLNTLVLAFASVLRQLPNAWLMLVGDGPLRADIEVATQRAGVAARVRFPGWTDDLPGVYGAIDVCVLSSLNEGTPVAAIEAMAAGRPVIATRVGGVPDIIDTGRTGILVPADDINALADAMLALARDAEARARMGQAASKEVISRFSHLRLVDDIDRLYADRLAAKRGTIRRNQ
jgi:glycosyltransferase involved in cell wall biosynthesis